MKNNTDPLLLEIQEEINRERMIKFANKYGVAVVVAAILLFVGVGLYQFWNQYQSRQAQATGDQIYSILRDGSQDEFTLTKLDATSKSNGYFEISLLNKAQFQIKSGDNAGAVASFDAVAKNSKAEKSMRDLAALNAATLLFNTNSKAEGLEKRLVDLTAADNTFKYSAMEMLAGYYIQNGEQSKTDTVIANLVKEANVPVTIAKRAKELSPKAAAEAVNEEE